VRIQSSALCSANACPDGVTDSIGILVLGVCRTARDFAEVVDQVQFLARTLILRRWSQTARGPAAIRFQVGSPPTGVSESPTARWDYIQAVNLVPKAPCLSNNFVGPCIHCRVGVHALGAGGCGFESHRRDSQSQRRSSMAERRNDSDLQLRWSFDSTTS
jgi:hypothetical protein